MMTNRSGNVGLIMTLLVLGLLMTVSTSYLNLVATESQVQGMIDNSDRALDAAFAGTQYAMSVVQANPYMFRDTLADVATRTYFVETVTTANQLESDWFYLDEDLQFLEEDDNDAPYRFRVATFAHPYDSLYYLVKSQGVYIEFEETSGIETNRYTAQIIARVRIVPERKVIRLDGWRVMTYQTNDGDFFTTSAF